MKKHLLASVMSIFIVFIMSTITAFASDTVNINMTSSEFLSKSNENGEITLSENITLSDSLKINGENYTIDLNGHTLTFTKDTNLFRNGANVTFKNGTINLDGVQGNADCILGVGDYSGNGNLTLDGVNLQANNYKSPYALIYVYNASTLNIENNSVLNASNDKSLSGGVIKTSTKDGKINITDSTLNLKGTVRGFVGGTVDIKNSSVTMTNQMNGINSSNLTVDNSQLAIKGCVGRALTVDGTNINIKNNSVVDLNNSAESDIRFKSEGKIEVDKSSQLNFKTVKRDEPVKEVKLNNLIVSEGYEYESDDKGNVSKACRHSKDPEIINAKDATCTEEGYTGDKVCPDCNEVIEKGTVIPTLTHNFEAGTCTHCGVADPNFKPVVPETPSDTEKPNDSQKPGDVEISGDVEQPNYTENSNTENNSGNETDAPQTGDNNSIYFMLGIAMISIAGLVALRKTASK